MTRNLCEVYRHHLVLDTPDDKGVSQRKKLLQVYMTTGKMPPLLDEEPRVIDAGQYLIEYFSELRESTPLLILPAGMGGAIPYYPPILFSEIIAWQTLRGVDLSWWEVSIIKALDRVYTSFMNTPPAQRKTATI